MKFSKLSQYFGGKYMPFWYAAFAIVMIWFLINLVNNASVSRYELTAYDANGKVLGKKTVQADTMSPPERLPVTKSYNPVKPIKFLD